MRGFSSFAVIEGKKERRRKVRKGARKEGRKEEKCDFLCLGSVQTTGELGKRSRFKSQLCHSLLYGLRPVQYIPLSMKQEHYYLCLQCWTEAVGVLVVKNKNNGDRRTCVHSTTSCNDMGNGKDALSSNVGSATYQYDLRTKYQRS